MDALLLLLLFMFGVLTIGAIGGLVALLKIRTIRHTLAQTQQRLAELERRTPSRAEQSSPSVAHNQPGRSAVADNATPALASAAAANAPTTLSPAPDADKATSAPRHAVAEPERFDPWGVAIKPDAPVPEPAARALPQQSPPPSSAPVVSQPPPRHPPVTPAQGDGFAAHLRRYWMIWLGGGCVGLAGIFMVRYSIEQGLLGPGARILLALTTGLVLHLIADRLHCRRGPSDVFAALAGGASITLYAALLAALYQLPQLAPLTVFIGMALVSLATMALALRQGPLLAALGMLGGYLVPLLVQSGQDLIEGALIYALILTASALLLMRYVWRRWLWFGALAGALFWWALSYPTPPTSDISRTLYLFALSWMLLAIPSADWLLAQRYSSPHRSWWSLLRSGEDPDAQRILLTLVPILLAQGINLWQEALTLHSAWSQLLLPLLLLYCAGRRPALAPLPGALLLILAAALLLRYLHLDGIHLLLQRPETQQAPLIALLTLLPLLASTCALHQLQKQRCFSGFWASLAAFAPLLFLGLGYLLFTEFSTDGHWALATLIAGLAYLALALRSSAALLQTVLLLAAHAAWSLAAVMWLREATLTLALALQLISLASLYRRTGLALLPWLIRLLLLGILIRLALNPWLVSYLPGQHWSLWTYGGATLCCFIASYLSPRSAPLQRWLQGAGATLLLLTLGTELRYWLYDGAIFSHRYSFTEASINTLIWGAGGLIYQWRSTLSQTVAALYRTLAAILLSLATANYLLLLVLVKNPLWGETVIAPTPLWNLLLLAYGVPVVLAVLAARFYPPFCAGTARRAALLTCGLSLLLFVSLEIRHLWQGALDISLPTSEGEQYTYSAVWLLLAASGMIVAIRRTASGLYRAAMALLLVDILKIFLVDLAGLEGLWRVASFMGLGLVLLGLAWLHQQLTPAEQPSPAGTQQAPDSTRRP